MSEESHTSVESSKTAISLAKAEDWLTLVAEHIDSADPIDIALDQEALVYLRSRGHDCHEQVTALIESWKTAEQARFDEYNQGSAVLDLMGGETTSKKRALTTDSSNFMEIPPIFLRPFWDFAPLGESSLDASMLRTADWCGIGGFEPWWRRLAQSRNEKLFQGGIEETAAAAYWLFHMLRSDYAIKLMPQVLNRYFEFIAFAGPNKRQPWVFDCGEGSSGREQHLAYASAIVFAHHRLHSNNVDPELVLQAVETICKHQDPHGAWRTQTGDTEVSVESTAMALHALALAQPKGWPRMAAYARDWLRSVQKDDGSWIEPGSSGPVHLTVLVLDATALVNAEGALTFRRSHESSGRSGDQSFVPDTAHTKPQGPRTTLKVTNWEHIEISFLSDERVQIRSGQHTETCNYAEFGFSDGRNERPRQAWTVLRVMAESNGIVRNAQKTGGDWPRVEKRIQEIRKLLQEYFGLSGDPLPFAEGAGYRAKFQIVRSRSFDT
jgi:hypothetical protein